MKFNLNPGQKDAVTNIGNPLLVLAGAGSGKTRVITEKIAYLIEKCEYSPKSITAVTFTNKAAKEMRERITKMLGPDKILGLNVSTFHTLGLRIINTEISSLPYRRGFSIFDSEDSINLVREILKIEKLPPDFAEQIRWQISTWKNGLISPEDAQKGVTTDLESNFIKIYKEYNRYLQIYNAVDFDDLIVIPVTLFNSKPNILEKWQNKIRYLLVDEYQDTNVCQYQFVKMLVGIRASFTVVGDDDQSIYSWRGAQPENLRLLVSDFPTLKVVKLEQNYRSMGRILKVANTLIDNNPHIFDKRLWSEMGYGDPIQVIRCKDSDHEAERVVSEILNQKFLKKAKNSDFAILFRGNHQIRVFEKLLRSHQIPYKISGSFSFFALSEIKDLMSYFRLVANMNDDSAFLRVINTPRREIGAKTIEIIRDYSSTKRISLSKAIGDDALLEKLQPRARERVSDFSLWLRKISEKANSADGGKIAREIVRDISFETWLADNSKDMVIAKKRRENVYELLDWIDNIQSEDGDNTLQSKVAHLSLMDMLDSDEDDGDSVNLLTLHASKGLEFPTVFMVGVEEDLLPHKASSDDEQGVEEERRLAYVGVTRAQKNLFITYAARRRIGADIIERQPSRFLSEMPQEDIVWQGINKDVDPVESKKRGKAHLAGLKDILSNQ